MLGEEMEYGSERIQPAPAVIPRILENGAVEHVLEGAKSEVPCGGQKTIGLGREMDRIGI